MSPESVSRAAATLLSPCLLGTPPHSLHSGRGAGLGLQAWGQRRVLSSLRNANI